MDCVCTGCGRQYEYDYKNKKGHSKSRCNSCVVNCRRKEIMDKCVAYCGGKCVKCGYDKCKRALHFHHLKPHTKEFLISTAHCRSWEAIKKELDKCILVCANCHAEIHDEENESPKHLNSRWVKKSNKVYYDYKCDLCKKDFKSEYKNRVFCSYKCSGLASRKVEWPSLQQLEEDLEAMPMVAVGRKYCVSDNAVRKWLKTYQNQKDAA